MHKKPNRLWPVFWLLVCSVTVGNVCAAPRERTLLDAGWRFHLGEVNGYTMTAPGIPLTQWIWIADNNAPNDAGTMAAPGLNTSGWSNITIGTDVFQGGQGAAWYRTTLTNLASSVRPLTLHFLGVDDDATVYLNGNYIGQHFGWSQSFDIPIDPSLVASSTNVLAVAVNNSGGGAGGIMAGVLLEAGADSTPVGSPVSQWRWLADDNAPQDAATMTMTNLDTSTWQVATNGQDVFNGRVGYAWFRTSLDDLASTNRPLTLHFGCVDDNATVYLNGILLGQHISSSQPFDITSVDSAWVNGGPNILAVAVQNTAGPGGIAGIATLESGAMGQGIATGDSQNPTSLDFNDESWRSVHLPHDYVIEGAFTNTANASHGSLPLNSAWYRRSFSLPTSAQGKSIWVDFDGVYHKSRVWLNGHYLGYWHSGYASFRYDISRFAIPGGTNVLTVYVDPSEEEGWWYEGGGIYRHVWLNIANPLHVEPWGTFVTSEVQGPDANGNASATLAVSTTITNAGTQRQTCTLISQAVGPDGVAVATATTVLSVGAGASTNVVHSVEITNARLWSIETPQLYELRTTVRRDAEDVDAVKTPFGIRSIRFDATNGFFLNGRRVEIKGMCNHQDFAGVGIAMPDNLHYWRIQKLKAMGANAYRCAHNPPAPELLDACDRLGMLVMDENRHLGDSTGGYSSATAQTPYTDLSPLNSLILRDRNHPSIILWSMCNEEGISGTQVGADIFYAMKKRVLQFDTTRPITCAMNHSWFNVGISLVQDVEGINYSPGQYDPFHQLFPTLPVYGSETASARSDRGMYTNDGVAYVSCLNTTTETSWEPVATRPYMAGAFIWTGFDYKGEPSPFGWPCINSKFGVMDMCGIPKDAYYYYQAWWRDQPLVHIFPHWNWSTGQTVNVWCYANSASVELFLNGTSQGVRFMPAYGHVEWSVPFASGTLLAKAYNAQGAVIATNQVSTAGATAAIQLTTDRTTVTADEQDLTVVYASVVDVQGRPVPTASNLISFAVTGPAGVVGVGNGDPASHEPDRAAQRKAFNGWCMALVGATNAAGAVTLTASSPGLAAATLNLQAAAITSPPAQVKGLSATAGSAAVKLDWTMSFGAASYNIKRSTVSGGPYTPVANCMAISFTDETVTNSVTYYYVVSGVNTNGEGLDSSEVIATPMATAPPVTPTGLTALGDDGGVGLTWNATAGAESYNIKRSTASGGPFTNIANSATAGCADSGLSNGVAYFYVVSALMGGTESSNSLQASATPISMSYLVGTTMGTTGSWNDAGNVREKTFDGDASTFFDAPTGNNNWVGLDMGTNTAVIVSKIRYFPRNGYADRMVGGTFQGANAANFSNAVTVANITSVPPFAANTVLITNATSFRYLRYLAPSSSYGNVAEVEFYTPGSRISRVTGSVFGTTGAATNTSDRVFDGNLDTYFSSMSSNGNWVALGVENPKVITHVRYCPRSGDTNRMVNGIFQGANTTNFSGATNLYVITNAPPDATLTARVIANTNAFRYVRYLSPTNSFGEVAELQFFSRTPNLPALPAVPTGLSANAGDEQVGLSWSSSSGATSYNVKRAPVSGGPYDTIANGVATIHMDSGLGQGTYHYVVSAVNDAGESADSAEASVALTCAAPAAPTGLSATTAAGRVTVSWFPVASASSYLVYRSETNAGPYSFSGAALTGNSFTDTSIISGMTYYYAVRAITDCGPGDYSQPIAIPSLPSPYLTCGASENGLLFSWPAWAGNYQLESATNLNSPLNWQPFFFVPERSNGVYLLDVPTTNELHFFRLRLLLNFP